MASLRPKSWTPHPQGMPTPLSLRHCCCDHTGIDPPYFSPGHLLAVRQPKTCIPAQSQPHLPTAAADSGQTPHPVTQALSGAVLLCVSSLVRHKPHSLYFDRPCPPLSDFLALAPASILTWHSFSSTFHLCLNTLLRSRSGSDASSCSVPPTARGLP